MSRKTKNRKWKEERRIRERMRNGDVPFDPYREPGNWSDELWDPTESAAEFEDEFDDEDDAEFGHLWGEGSSRDVG